MQADKSPLSTENQHESEAKDNPFTPQAQKYFSKLIHINGKHMYNFQTSHIMVMYFIVQGLAVSDALNHVDKNTIVNYIKSLQISDGGFAPSSLYTGYTRSHEFDLPHVVFTYSADLRFVYASLAVCNALEDFLMINKAKVKSYIDSCFNYDGGYGLRPYCQSHSGAVYCAVASYRLMGYEIPNINETLQFLVNRQTVNANNNITGVQGRVGKLPDSCYTFWIGASIKILTGQNLLHQSISQFLKLCYTEETFNFSKYPNTKGDPLHTLHSIVGLKILSQNDKNLDIIQGVAKFQ